MPYHPDDSHADRFRCEGYAVLRSIIPASLVADLRRVLSGATSLARREQGETAQRLQPLGRFGIDAGVLRSFAQLPELTEALARTVGTPCAVGNPDTIGVLIEPAHGAWCTAWHRDWRDNVPQFPELGWDDDCRDRQLFNQVNCALFADEATWIVPGSHQRGDTLAESRFRGAPAPVTHGCDLGTAERACLEYAQSMPGALRLRLDPGDVAVYRSSLWHLGAYSSAKRRLTLHDYADTDAYVAWRARTLASLPAQAATT